MRTRAKELEYQKPAESKSTAHTVAHFLNWFAEKAPKEYINYHVMTKHVLGYARVPLMHSKEVEMIKSSMGRAKKLLRDVYGREFHSVRNVGVRATVDDADKLKIVLPGRVKNADRATMAVKQTIDNINVSQIADNAENKRWKEWLRRDVKDALRLAESLTTAVKALPGLEEQPSK